MSTQTATTYLTLGYLKASLGIAEEKTNNDEKLINIVNIANEEIDMRLRPYLGNAPIAGGTESYVQATKCAISHARSLWFEHLGQFERATHADDQYEKKIEKLIEAVKSDKPERQIAEFIPGADPTPIYQPYHLDDYIARIF